MRYSSVTICLSVHPVCNDGAEVGLGSSKESCDRRQQIGQGASGLLWTLSRRRNHFLKRCGLWPPGRRRRRFGCCCLASQTTCEQGPEAEGKRKHRGAGEQRRQQGHVGGRRIFACCASARLGVEVALESTAGRSPTQVQTCCQWPAKTPVIFEESVNLQGTQKHRKSGEQIAL